jgi:hypothetical protein
MDEAWPMGHDVMFGLAGLGVYALERLPRPIAAEMLSRVIDRLDAMAERRATKGSPGFPHRSS